MSKENAVRTDNHVPGMMADYNGETKRIKADLDGNLKTSSKLVNSEGDIDVQNPLPTNGDQVYVKDINLTVSTSVNWSGSISDLFDNIFTPITNITSDNPKTLLMVFNRPLQTNLFGFGTATGDFSNTKITAIQLGGVENILLDESADNTKITNKVVKNIPPITMTAIKVEFFTADTVTLTGFAITKALQRISRMQGVSELTGSTEDVNTFRNALKVDSALVHKIGVSEPFIRETGPATTLTVAAEIGDTDIIVDDTTGFVTGDQMVLRTNGTRELGILTITNVVANVITLDRPLSFDYPIGTDVLEVTDNLSSLAGTLASPVSYTIGPPEGQIWQLTRMLLTIADGSSMDDGKFGGIPALTNGVVIRSNREAISRAATVWKKNGDMKLDMYDIAYSDKAPAGEFGLAGRWTFTKAEFIVELNGDDGDFLEVLIQDDLTDLTSFKSKCQGRLFGG